MFEKLSNYLKTLCTRGTPLVIRFNGLQPYNVLASGKISYQNYSWGVGYIDPQTKMEGCVMLEYVYIQIPSEEINFTREFHEFRYSSV